MEDEFDNKHVVQAVQSVEKDSLYNSPLPLGKFYMNSDRGDLLLDSLSIEQDDEGSLILSNFNLVGGKYSTELLDILNLPSRMHEVDDIAAGRQKYIAKFALYEMPKGTHLLKLRSVDKEHSEIFYSTTVSYEEHNIHIQLVKNNSQNNFSLYLEDSQQINNKFFIQNPPDHAENGLLPPPPMAYSVMQRFILTPAVAKSPRFIFRTTDENLSVEEEALKAEVTSTPRLESVPLKKSSHAIAAEQSFLSENDGIVTVTTDNSKQWRHQVETDRFPVKPGDRLQVRYNINASEGGMIAFDLLNTRKAWFFKGAKRVILKDGDQTGVIEYEVPEGEREASLAFYNDKASFTPTQLKINRLTIENTLATE